MDFMAMPVCQNLLTTIYYGEVANFTSSSLMFTATLCPLLVRKIKFFKPQFKLNLEKNQQTDGEKVNAERNEHSGSFHNDKARIKKVAWKTDDKRNKIGILPAIRHLYTSPYAKFVTHAIISNFVLLILLSNFAYLIVSGLKKHVTGVEILVWVWMNIIAMYEIKQAKIISYLFRRWTIKNQMMNGVVQQRRAIMLGYLRDIWNKMDVISYLLMMSCMITRAVLHYTDGDMNVWLIILRSIYGLSYFVLVLRQMYIFYAAKTLGPYVIAIGQMMVDLYRFLLIFIMVICAFNVPLTGMQYNDALPIRDGFEALGVLRRIIFEPLWWPLNAPSGSSDNFRRDITVSRVIEKDGCSANTSVDATQYSPCKQVNPAYPILLLVAVTITNTLLINTLIAMFSYTFQQVKEKADKVWAYTQYSVVKEFYERPALPPPFMIFSMIIEFFSFLRNIYLDKTQQFIDTDFAKYYGNRY